MDTPAQRLSEEEVLDHDQIITGKNVTRQAYNKRMRRMLGFEGIAPARGKRLVCLRNNKPLGIFNGGLFEVMKMLGGGPDRLKIRMKRSSEGFPRRAPITVSVRREFFFGGIEDLDWRVLKNSYQFDYGYALTCHKSQGSQWPRMIVYDESGVFRDDAQRWLYTAITRAEELITVVR